MNKIIVARRPENHTHNLDSPFRAQLESGPGWWVPGKTPSEAIGNLILQYKIVLGIEIEYDISINSPSS